MNRVNLDEFNMSDAELFAPVNHDELESEKITAPRYSYWQSVFRVFFRKKINVIMLTILAVLLIFTYIYPLPLATMQALAVTPISTSTIPVPST